MLGSASGAMLAQSSESLAGRLAYVELTPLLVGEVLKGKTAKADDVMATDLWVRGGFPNSFLARSASSSMSWRQQFITVPEHA
jgi:uncharacterized protein